MSHLRRPNRALHVSYLIVTLVVNFDSVNSINRTWEILDQIPGRATGAYTHSHRNNVTPNQTNKLEVHTLFPPFTDFVIDFTFEINHDSG